MGMIMMIAIMMVMDIQVIEVREHDGHADVHVLVDVPGISTRGILEIAIVSPVDLSRDQLAEIAYDRALMMLDPA